MLFLRRRSRVAVKPEALPESVGQRGVRSSLPSATPKSPEPPEHFMRSPSWKMFEKIELRKNI
jgi:hypothetical protein